jgi:iron complex transport system substrate-binding protein
MATGGGRGIGDFIGLAGGSGIGADVIPGMAGPLSLEYIIGKAPAVYIGTGGGYMAARGGLVVGASVSEEQARDSLQSVLSRKGFGELPAVASGRAYGLSHGLAISGINIVAIEAIAGWIHPELFPDIDPEATLMEIGKRFLPAQLEGTWWVEAASKDWK